MDKCNFVMILTTIMIFCICMLRGSNGSQYTFPKEITLTTTGLNEILDYAKTLTSEEAKVFNSTLKKVFNIIEERCVSSQTKACQPTWQYCSRVLGRCQPCVNLCSSSRAYGKENVQQSCREKCGLYLLIQELNKILKDLKDRKNITNSNHPRQNENTTITSEHNIAEDSIPWKAVGIISLCINTILIVLIAVIAYVTKNVNKEEPCKWAKQMYGLLICKNIDQGEDDLPVHKRCQDDGAHNKLLPRNPSVVELQNNKDRSAANRVGNEHTKPDHMHIPLITHPTDEPSARPNNHPRSPEDRATPTCPGMTASCPNGIPGSMTNAIVHTDNNGGSGFATGIEQDMHILRKGINKVNQDAETGNGSSFECTELKTI